MNGPRTSHHTPILDTVYLAVRGEPVEPQLPFDTLRANGWEGLCEQHCLYAWFMPGAIRMP